MTRDDVIRLAREAGLQTDTSGVWVDDGYIENQLTRFAQAVAAIEREACAKVCEAQEDDLREWDIQQQCANAIRARGET